MQHNHINEEYIMRQSGHLTRLKLFLLSLSLLLMALLNGCGGGGALPAAPDVTESFRADAGKNVAIKSAALNREFLLHGNIIRLQEAQQFENLKSRVVVFQKQGSKLFMLESQVGHTVMPDSPFALILAEFPIVAEESGWIYFDFNQGMSKIFTAADMYASDSDGSGYQPSFKAVSVRSSFLSVVDVSRLNRLAIRQSAQVEAGDNELASVEVRYYLSPYLPDPSFKPTESPGFDHAGYFEVMPQLEKGGKTKVFTTKWNLNKKPITYYLSANTPQEYRQAVRDGVLYWNAALGEEVFAVADAPADVTAPDMDRNIIQWVDYETAGSAYADIQADPRTGEILHAQVFMPSVFAVGSKKGAWQFLKQMESSGSFAAKRQIALQNLYASRLCDLPAKDKLLQGIKALLAANATDEMILKASQAYVQESLTHEVGHTLGLRHNFAGTLAADHAGHTRQELYLNYLRGGTYIPMLPSSSVMDYHDKIESALVVNRYATERKALPHDMSAIRYLYLGKELDTTIPFCTDTDAGGELIDCVRFDYGNSPLEYASSQLHENLSVDSLPIMLYLQEVAKVMDGTSVSNLRPSATAVAADLLKSKTMLLTAFTDAGLYAQTLKKLYPGMLLKEVDTNALRAEVMPVVIDDLKAWLLKNSYSFNSVTDMFMIIDPAWKDAWINRFNQISEDPAFITIIDAEGNSRTFTPAERQQLRTMAAKFFTDLIPALVAQDLKLLGPGTAKIDIVDGIAGRQLLNAMNATSRRYLLDQTGEALNEPVGGVALTLPLFRYNWEQRLNASKLLDKRTVPSALWWGVRETAENKNDLKAILDQAVLGLGVPFSTSAVSGYFTGASNNALQWYLENQKLM